MGCDIHLYIEYKRKNENDKQFRNFAGRINPGRNYFMFGLLCKGVRSDNEDGIEQRGLPEIDTLGYNTLWDSRLYITEDPSDEGRDCTLEQALSWVENSSTRKIYYRDGVAKWVDDPDAHSRTWLTSTEYSTQIYKYNNHPEANKYKEPEYEAILAVLNSLENNGFETRVVFWFDN